MEAISLFKEERQKKIHSLIERTNSVYVNDLADNFGVSVETIRRDLNVLERNGVLTRTYGGAISSIGQRKDNEQKKDIHTRSEINSEEKKKIAGFAKSLIKPGDVIYLSPSSTAYHLAGQLAEIIDITVLTNSLLITERLAESKTVNVIVIGGLLKKHEVSLINIFNDDLVSSIHIDKVFLGCTGIHPIHGLTNNNNGELGTDSRIAAIHKKVTVLADSTKFGYVGTNNVAPIEFVGEIITTKRASSAVIDKLSQQGIKIHRV